MIDNVSVSKFRNNIFGYINLATKKKSNIGVTKGKKLIGWFVPNANTSKEHEYDKVDMFLEEVAKIQKKFPMKGGKNLSRDIDKILYGKK